MRLSYGSRSGAATHNKVVCGRGKKHPTFEVLARAKLPHFARKFLTTGVIRLPSQPVARWPHGLATEIVSAPTYLANAAADSALTLWSSHE